MQGQQAPSLAPAWTFSHVLRAVRNVQVTLMSMNSWLLMQSLRDIRRHHSRFTDRD